MKASEVFDGQRLWSNEAMDAFDWWPTLTDNSVDMLLCSPFYEKQRSYSLDAKLPKGEAWVSWMLDLLKLAAPKVRGPMFVVCEGATEKFSYSCVPILLMADLKRAGFTLRKPAIFRRIGIPGSGGPDGFRNDYEFIIEITRPGRLGYADPTACGHEPKYPKGGELSHRTKDGRRVGTATKGQANGDAKTVSGGFTAPKKSNPGSVIAETYTAEQVAAMLKEQGDVLDCKVGGGHMGHRLASKNEAPFPLTLAERLIKTFCPPRVCMACGRGNGMVDVCVGCEGRLMPEASTKFRVDYTAPPLFRPGVVGDCFSGSGTSAQCAVENGFRFVGCDLRQNQIDLCAERMAGTTLSMVG